MTLVVMKASRSAVIKNAKDLSCAILTYDHRLVSTEEALPIHVMSMDKATRPITELFDDIKQGDIFLNNCPYTGGTHHADMILSMPVFFRGAPLGRRPIPSRGYRRAGSVHLSPLCTHHL
jgi:N-methylhydantoinase B